MSFSAPISRAQRSRRILPWLLYLYALVLFAMHFVRIFDNSFWGDEGFSIGLAQMNVFEMLQVTAADNHPPLYYLFTQLLYHLLGNHGYVYHLSALIPYGLILILACTVIFRQFGLIPAVVVSTFASLTDTAIMFNVEARMYSLGAFFVLAAYLALHNILHSGKTSDWVIFSVASLCAAYTHYYALISVAFFYLALLSLLPRDKSSFKKILITYCAAVVVYLPWLLVLLPTFKRAAKDWWSTFIPSPINCIGFFFNPSWTVLIFGLAFLLYFTAQAKSSSKWLFAPDTIWLLTGLLSAADYLPGRPLTVLTGVLRDKDYQHMYAPLLPYAARFITVTPDSPRALPAQELAAYLAPLGKPVTACTSIAEGAALALEGAAADGAVLCCGSLYLMGDAKAALLR